jgi:hypothetical protein
MPSPPAPFPPFHLGMLVRPSTPIRVSFLHAPVTGGGRGPLSELVRQRRSVALDLLLLCHAIWPLCSPDPVAVSAVAWADALGLDARGGVRSTISRSWTWLEQRQLIATSAAGRLRAITPLCEDGSARRWQHPAETKEPYLQLPNAYWEGGLPAQLGLPAKAVLLIGLSLQRDAEYFELPLERGAAWYGLSERTIRLGLRELRAAKLMRTWVQRRPSENSPTKYTFDRRHSLNSLDAYARRRRRDAT